MLLTINTITAERYIKTNCILTGSLFIKAFNITARDYDERSQHKQLMLNLPRLPAKILILLKTGNEQNAQRYRTSLLCYRLECIDVVN